jgi:hypothetical protein
MSSSFVSTKMYLDLEDILDPGGIASACLSGLAVRELFITGTDLDPIVHRNLHHINQVTDRRRGAFVETVLKHGQEARHFYTKKGWLGYGPKVLEDGDLICVFPSYRLPTALRKVGDYYQLIGTCFVLGLMDGEAAQMLNRAEVFMQKFDIH